ncbi:protein kinase [Streptomyces gamaensis]|uniref:non-specific serine/threonine protein kinase n=1 Tax=Streptomyces gamaensis TaxID=1763542 RepID=A0ABW0Z1J5_9ACTN
MDGEANTPLLGGRYRLVEPLGSGGMGVVWRAVDELLGRQVAAKEVRAPEHLSEHDVRVLYARLLQEARAAARISHPYVITVHDVVEQEGRPWIVMELVRGRSLAEAIAHEGALSPEETARVGAKVLQALRAAHACGVLHRDVKPANVLLEDGGRVVLTDFGIALVEGSNTLTRTGDLIGSPDFLAPERALGERPGTPSDLWSLGATLYAAVEGVSPFRRTTPLGTLQAVVRDEPPPPRRASPLAPLLAGLLRKDPRARTGSAEAQRLLDAVAAADPPPARSATAAGVYVPTAPTPTPSAAAPGTVTYGRPSAGNPYAQPPLRPYSPAPGTSQARAAAAHGLVPGYGPVPGAGDPSSGGAYGPVPGYGAAPGPAGALPAGAAAGYPVRPAAGDGRRKAAVYLGPVLAFVLVAGGAVAAVVAARDGGGAQTPPGGASSSGSPRPAQGATASQPPAPPLGPGYSTTTPAYGSTGTCGGGWLATC